MSSTAAVVTSEKISSAVLGAATAWANSAIRAAKAKFACSDIQVYGAGESFTFLFGPAVLGAGIHMAVGAAYGALFGVIARLLRWHGAVLVGMAVVWVFVVFAVSAWVGLPAAASLFGGGDPISNMASMVGYPTFIAEHLAYGAVLGLLLITPLRRGVIH